MEKLFFNELHTPGAAVKFALGVCDLGSLSLVSLCFGLWSSLFAKL